MLAALTIVLYVGYCCGLSHVCSVLSTVEVNCILDGLLFTFVDN